MIHNNFSSIQNRVKRLYSVEGLKVSESGIQTGFLKTASISVGIATVFGVIICIIGGEVYYNPLRNGLDDINPAFLIFFVGAPIGLSIWLENGMIAKVQVKTAIKKIIQTFINSRIDSDGKRFRPRDISNTEELV